MYLLAKIVKKIFDSVFYSWLAGAVVIFLIAIPTSDFSTALVGSIVFGLMALPITWLVLIVIALLLPYDIDQIPDNPSPKYR